MVYFFKINLHKWGVNTPHLAVLRDVFWLKCRASPIFSLTQSKRLVRPSGYLGYNRKSHINFCTPLAKSKGLTQNARIFSTHELPLLNCYSKKIILCLISSTLIIFTTSIELQHIFQRMTISNFSDLCEIKLIKTHKIFSQKKFKYESWI